MLNPIKLASKNFLSSLDISYEEFHHILEIAKNFKNKDLNIKLKEKVLGLIFSPLFSIEICPAITILEILKISSLLINCEPEFIISEKVFIIL